MGMARSTVTVGDDGVAPDAHLELLRNQCDSELERRFLDMLASQRRRLPSHGQKFIARAQVRPDFLYAEEQVAVFIDGPPHDDSDVKADDENATARLLDLGYHVVRLPHQDDWDARLDEYPNVFGTNGGSE